MRILSNAVIWAVLWAAFLMPVPAAAQTACFPRALVEKQLHSHEKEEVKGRGIAPNGWLIEHWQSTDGVSFTITITTPKGLTCLLAAGSDWEWVILRIPPEGEAEG